MGAGKNLRIFLSSTFEDLKDHRARVAAALDRLGVVVRRMETFGALPGHNVAECTRRAREADAVVLILAHRLGWVPSVAEGGDGKKSITRLEAEAAHTAKVPIFAFVVDEKAAWEGGRDTEALIRAKTDDETGAALQRVREFAEFKGWAGSQGRIYDTFRDASELAEKTLASLANWRITSGDRTVQGERELIDYLRKVINDHGFLDIRGIAIQGSGQKALRPTIENLYTTLRCRVAGGGFGESQPLVNILNKSRRILIEGAAGAGKSTFLRLVTTMLARDLRQEPCALAPTWREAHLGLPAAEKPKIPIFLRLAGLTQLFQDDSTKKDDRWRLLDLLVQDYGAELDRQAWAQRLEEGSAFLLLDGLDEVADLGQRERIFEIFADAEKAWKAPLLVASRPFRTEELRNRGFLVATLEPFGDQEIRDFLRLWVGILHQEAHPTTLETKADAYRQALELAMLSRANIRELAANPGDVDLPLCGPLERRSIARRPRPRLPLGDPLVARGPQKQTSAGFRPRSRICPSCSRHPRPKRDVQPCGQTSGPAPQGCGPAGRPGTATRKR